MSKTKTPSERTKDSNDTNDFSRALYENTTPVGVKTSVSIPKIRFQKDISLNKNTNYKVFNRYLKFKFGNVQDKTENIGQPIKKPKTSYIQRNIYDLLKLEPGCSKNDIKKSYRKLATVHHPDKGGNPLHFRCLNQAYEILSNDELREIYDSNGFKAIKNISDVDTSELETYIFTNESF
jgi:DnaJ domain